jgi:hypothetical protein
LPTTSDITDGLPHSAELLTGRVAEYGQLQSTVAERPGLLVVTSDPWSGTSPMLRSVLDDIEHQAILVDARRCRDAVDLAMAIADRAVGEFAPAAERWWMSAAPPSDAGGLRLARALSSLGLEPDDLRLGLAEGTRALRQAVEVLATLSDQAILAIDHLGPMLSALPVESARELLGTLRAIRQQFPAIDLVLVEYPEGPIGAALADDSHPLYRAGVRLRIRRAHPSRFVTDLAITRGWTKIAVDLIGAAAELANGVPALAWSIVKLAPAEPDFLPTRAFAGWQELRRLTAPTTAHQWEVLRRVHPLAQPIIAAMSVGMRPHSIGANSKSVNEGLKRLREVGLAWRTERRYWALADPLLAAWARDHAAPWAQRKSQLASTARTVRSEG